jgi:hypothetical protein
MSRPPRKRVRRGRERGSPAPGEARPGFVKCTIPKSLDGRRAVPLGLSGRVRSVRLSRCRCRGAAGAVRPVRCCSRGRARRRLVRRRCARGHRSRWAARRRTSRDRRSPDRGGAGLVAAPMARTVAAARAVRVRAVQRIRCAARGLLERGARRVGQAPQGFLAQDEILRSLLPHRETPFPWNRLAIGLVCRISLPFCWRKGRLLRLGRAEAVPFDRTIGGA